MNISSQDFRNSYEKFYVAMRKYLWPYEVLKELGEVEVDIYSAFIDVQKLSSDFSKLKSSIRQEAKDDENLQKASDDIQELIDLNDKQFYSRIYRVGEVNQEKNKQLRTILEKEEE